MRRALPVRQIGVVLAAATLWLLADSVLAADEPPSFGHVRALFAAKCLACHGNDAQDLKGKYDLRTRAAAMKGGESGESAIVPGEPEKSPLYRAVTWEDDTLQMPPKENDRLTAEQVVLIRRWIAAGAKWDEPARSCFAKSWRRLVERTRTAFASPPAAASRPIGTTARMSRMRSGRIGRSAL